MEQKVHNVEVHDYSVMTSFCTKDLFNSDEDDPFKSINVERFNLGDNSFLESDNNNNFLKIHDIAPAHNNTTVPSPTGIQALSETSDELFAPIGLDQYLDEDPFSVLYIPHSQFHPCSDQSDSISNIPYTELKEVDSEQLYALPAPQNQPRTDISNEQTEYVFPTTALTTDDPTAVEDVFGSTTLIDPLQVQERCPVEDSLNETYEKMDLNEETSEGNDAEDYPFTRRTRSRSLYGNFRESSIQQNQISRPRLPRRKSARGKFFTKTTNNREPQALPSPRIQRRAGVRDISMGRTRSSRALAICPVTPKVVSEQQVVRLEADFDRLVTDLEEQFKVFCKKNKITTDRKEFQEWYLKGCFCYGITFPHVEKIVKEWATENNLGVFDESSDKILVCKLFSSNMNECKYAGVFYMQAKLKKGRYTIGFLHELEKIYETDLVKPWNISNSCAMKNLRLFIKQFEYVALDRIVYWAKAKNVWQARSSVIALSEKPSFIDFPTYYEAIWDVCSNVIQREEEIARVVVGGFLRQFAAQDLEATRVFLNKFIAFFDIEVMKNATTHFSKNEREDYCAQVRKRRI